MRTKMMAASAAVALCAALVACDEETSADADGDGEITLDEVRAEMESEAGNMRPEAGKYTVNMTMVNADIPGAPPEMVEMMGTMMNNSFEYCLTPEEAEQGWEESLKQGQDESCTIEKFELDSGDIDMAMTCTPQGGGEMRVAMTGNATPTRSEMTITTNGTLPQLGEANMEMSMVQERIGDCDA
ncbi:MAG: DUF3617 domain-containing protein [Pseudomonadota bacterium]